MREIFAATVGGLRGPGLTTEQSERVNQAIEAGESAIVALETVSPSAVLIDLSTGTPNAALGGGASYVVRGGAITGLSVPNGSTGQGSLLIYARDTAIKPLAGARVRMTVKLKVSTVFDRAMTFEAYSFNAPSGVTLLGPIGAESLAVVDGVLTYSAVFDLPDSAVGFQVAPRVTSAAAASGVQTVEGLSVTFAPIEVADGVSRADAAINTRLRQVYAQVETGQRPYGRIALVTAPGEGGEFTSIKAAIAALQPYATRSSRARLRIAPKPGGAAYQEREISADFIDMVSASPGAYALIDGSQPNNAPAADITNNSVFSRIGDVSMEWIKAVGANIRYVHHWDYSFSTGKLWRTRNCFFHHLGNEGARQYQISQGNDPDAPGPNRIWPSMDALGGGVWDDCHMESFDSTWWSPVDTIACHDQFNETEDGQPMPFGRRGSTLLFDNCEVEAGVTVNPVTGAITRLSQTGGDPAGVNAFLFTSYGQPATNLVTLRNNRVIFGNTSVIPVGRPGQTPPTPPTRSRFVLDGYGNAPLAYVTFNPDWNAGFAGGAAAVSRIL